MPKRKSSSNPISDHFKSQRKTHNQLSGLGDSMARGHYFKMVDRTQHWLDSTENQVNALYSQNKSPSRSTLFKLDLLRWMHSKYFDAATDHDGGGLVGVFFTLLAGLGYIVVLSALYVLLATAAIWLLPLAFDWIFHLE
ncbi:MAG: hypothetical protein HN842_03890 [Gammaproteobacteria bacterium]|jgi:hypothetical protein|nr:hypothetical protein [Gammaproteobacteria bacterium]